MLARYGGAFGASAAIHAAVAAWIAWSTYVPAPRAHERPVQVVLLPPSEDSTFPGVRPVDRTDPGWQPADLSQEGQIAGADLARIGAHLPVLFPFVVPGLALDAFFPDLRSDTRLTFVNPFVKAPAPRADAARSLRLTAAQIQAIVDQSWTRARRWDAFAKIRTLAETADANDVSLAALLGTYREQNALQPYADGAVRDLRLWAQLGLAADHVSFIGFIRDYAVMHPHTKATTELLLLLDTLAEANEDALAVLVESDQPDDLEWTKRTHPRAYLVARQINKQYTNELVRRGLTSRRAVEAYYERARLNLLWRVLATTPDAYRANDIKFLIGSILWKQDRRDEALRAWRGLAASAGDSYGIAIAQLRDALTQPLASDRNIDHILRNQEGRWMAASDERLRRFGYRADAY